MFSLSREDGYVRTTLAQLQTIALKHLVSGLDEDAPHETHSGAECTVISGYTEYVHDGVPALTIGWDWEMSMSGGPARLRRVGEPRSNIMLQDEQHHDLGFLATEQLLGNYVDSLGWEALTLAAISARYKR
ncbi:DUF4902 domain-containing protein [Pseudoduganella sp.]|uniref:DUF4902 domain-containing protein n=1 Tax=Pseudoduganella sp. TaxID=1880898 RepID=UPI0035B4A65E